MAGSKRSKPSSGSHNQSPGPAKKSPTPKKQKHCVNKAPRPSPTGRKLTSDEQIIEKYEPCQHKNNAFFRQIFDESYFTITYVSREDVIWPRNCAICGTDFIGCNYKTSLATPVWCCNNAARSLHPCDYGLCVPCYNKEFEGKRVARNRKPKVRVD